MADKKNALHEECMDRYKMGCEAAAKNHKRYREDNRFVKLLEQWPEEAKTARGDSRPCLVVDKLNQYVRQVVNDGRQNRPQVKVRPIDDHGDVKIAETLQGIVRHICDRSNADEALDTALDCAVTGGFGFLRVCTEYAHEKTFNQEIAVKRIKNPLSVILEPGRTAADGSDVSWGFVVDKVPKDEFKTRWPDAKVVDFKSDKYSEGWCTDDFVQVAEYFYKVEVPQKLHLLVTGETATDEEYQDAAKMLPPDSPLPEIVETRDIPAMKVKWCRVSGAEILEENEWLGKYVPVVPVYGNEIDDDGETVYTGLIRAAKDAQRLYNYSRSAFAERVAMTPLAPYKAAAAATEGYEDEWERVNKPGLAVVHFNHVDAEGNQIPTPARESPSDIPAGFAQDMQISEHDIQGALGMYASSLGTRGNATSGRQELAQIREADTGTFHYQDNLNRAVRLLGRILVDLAPKIYDSRRVIRMLGEDGKATEAMIDPDQQMAVQKLGNQTIYNLNVGTYDVSVQAGPSYTTKRQEAAEAMVQMTKGNPGLMQIIGDLMVRAQDWPGADQIADRLKKMLPPQLQDQEGEAEIPEEVKAAMQEVEQGQQMLQQAQEQLMQAAQKMDSDKAALDAEQAELKAAKAALDAAKSELSAEKRVLTATFNELSAKLELKARDTFQPVPPTMPEGPAAPVLYPELDQPQGIEENGYLPA